MARASSIARAALAGVTLVLAVVFGVGLHTIAALLEFAPSPGVDGEVQRTAAVPLAAEGPHAVGFRRWSAAETTVPATVWYPARQVTPTGPGRDVAADRSPAAVPLLGLRVQSLDGHRLTLVHALTRNTAKLAPWQLAHTAVFRMAAGSPQRRWPALAVGAQLVVVGSAVTLLRDPDHRCWHDRLTRTMVVAASRRAAAQATC